MSEMKALEWRADVQCPANPEKIILIMTPSMEMKKQILTRAMNSELQANDTSEVTEMVRMT